MDAQWNVQSIPLKCRLRTSWWVFGEDFRVREGSGLLYVGRARKVILDKKSISDKYLKVYFDDENNNKWNQNPSKSLKEDRNQVLYFSLFYFKIKFI